VRETEAINLSCMTARGSTTSEWMGFEPHNLFHACKRLYHW